MKFHVALLMGFSPKWVSIVNVHDLVRGSIDAMLSDRTLGKTYTITGDRAHTWKEIFNEIAWSMESRYLSVRLPHALVLTLGAISGFLGRFTKKPPVFNYDKGIDFVQTSWTCSNDDAAADFGYSPRISLRDGIQQTTAWYRAQGWL